MKGKSLSRVQLFATPWTAAYQAPPPVGFSRQEYWSGVPPAPPKKKYRRRMGEPTGTSALPITQVEGLRPTWVKRQKAIGLCDGRTMEVGLGRKGRGEHRRGAERKGWGRQVGSMERDAGQQDYLRGRLGLRRQHTPSCRVATREESGVLGFPSRRGLTPRGDRKSVV